MAVYAADIMCALLKTTLRCTLYSTTDHTLTAQLSSELSSAPTKCVVAPEQDAQIAHVALTMGDASAPAITPASLQS